MKKFPIVLILLGLSNSLAAATVAVEACAEFEVTESSVPGVIGSVPERCISLAIDVEAGVTDDAVTRSDARRQLFAHGGCNTTGSDVTYTAERRVRYSITSQVFPPDERSRAKVEFSWLPDTFTSGADSITESFDGVISDGLCVDFFGEFSAFAEASSGLNPFSLTNPTGVNGLFYDQNNPGHGLNFIRHKGGFTVYYYGHTASGERLWLVSDLFTDRLYYFSPIQIEMFEVTTGGFGTPMLPETSWGNIRIWLDDCDSGSAMLDGIDGQLQFDFVRLAGLEHQDCY